MKKEKLTRVLSIGMCIAMLTGCGIRSTPNTTPDSSGNADNGIRQDIPADDNFNNLLGSADIAGTVLDFSDSGCKISQMKTDSNGEIAFEADPDNVTEDMTVFIQYKENCEVQIADVNHATGEADIKDGTISDIKKESQLYIFGEFTDTHNLTATKIIIVHYE